MKRILVLAFAVALAPLASAQLYKYVDKDGKTVYTDQPPPSSDPKALRIPSTAAGPAPSAPAKSYVQQDKELQKSRDKLRDEEKKSDEKAQRAAAEAQRCETAKNAFQHYQDGGRITKYNEKGEKVFLGDEEIDAEREKARRAMDEACKKS